MGDFAGEGTILWGGPVGGLGDFQARGQAAGHAGDPENPRRWGVLGGKEGEGYTGNEEETTHPWVIYGF